MSIEATVFFGVQFLARFMSSNVANKKSIIIVARAKAPAEIYERIAVIMKRMSEELKKIMTDLLNERLSEREITSLRDEGFSLKKPTRKAAVMISLYKKAISGDISAIKELRSIVSADNTEANEGTVMIVDDI